MILDTLGELVWFKPLPGPDEVPFNFRVQTYKGKPTLTWFQGAVIDAHGEGQYVLADNTYQPIGQVLSTGYPCDLHEFIITPDDTALHTAYDDNSLQRGGTPVFIGHAQEVDIATNELLFDWASYPGVGLDASYTQPAPGYYDYFHINSIDLWPGPDRDLLICHGPPVLSIWWTARPTGELAPRWQAERLLDGAGQPVLFPARRPRSGRRFRDQPL